MKNLKAYRSMHAEGRFPGHGMLQWVPDIAALVGEFKSRRILDYGCGAGLQYRKERAHVVWGLDAPMLYDPAVAEFNSALIGQFDGVICTDVLQCVPEDELAHVIGQIALFARKWAFISVCCRASGHVFRNGADIHVTIRPFDWWHETLRVHFKGETRLVLRESK